MGRIHVVLPDDLLTRLDEHVGERDRSRFISDAVRELLDRLELEDAAQRAAGSLSAKTHRHWRDRTAAADWVRAARRDA